MQSLIHNLKFLLDENVKISLLKFLKEHRYDVKASPKTTNDKKLALISKQEHRILVTNDDDFKWFKKSQIYSVILLKIPQNDTKTLTESFSKLLSEFKNFQGRIVELKVNSWLDYPLFSEVIL
ncbi:DUF5615 family PIN-like protein [Candidatus Daviesbacteria bacterium]|nr:DUF5615 family PIN-like protein [Candidatus Daviesbacteria bacterium]